MVRKSISVILALAFAVPAFAQTPVPVIRDQSRDTRQNLQQKAQDAREGFKSQMQDARESLKSRTEGAREEFKVKREEAKVQFEAKREQFKQELETKREELKARMETEREGLKTRLQKVKDEKKRQAVERIADQIAELNTRRLDHFSAVLEKLEKVLERIVSRIEKAAVRGLDVTAPRAEVEKAKTAIAEAREVIKTQTGKVYTVLTSTSTESGLKQEVGNVRKLLHGDLKKVEEAVKAARDAAHKAATALAEIRGVDEEPTPASAPTSTATTTNP